MSGPAANMLVSVVDNVVCIKISGRANFTSSVAFKKLIHEMLQRGLHRFILDLSECMLMDSTFLGVLASIGVKLNATPEARNGNSIELLNPNQRVSDLLDNLGVMEMFRVVKGTDPLNLQFESFECQEASKLELSRNCLEAHRTLMDVNPENVAKFREVTQFLARDVENLEGQEK
jgi:anti-sigma B factor antagonist